MAQGKPGKKQAHRSSAQGKPIYTAPDATVKGRRSTGKPQMNAPVERRRSTGKPKMGPPTTTTKPASPEEPAKKPVFAMPKIGSTMAKETGYNYVNANVDRQVDRITDTNSALMVKARADGRATAAIRGLGNSSMAAQAGESAVLDKAIQMGSQNAAQIHDRNMVEHDFRAKSSLADQAHVINQKINRATFDYNTALADQSFDHQTQLNDQGFDHSRRLNNQSYNQNRRLNEQNHGFNRELQDADNASREVIATMDANTRLQINQDTLNAQERAETARLMQEADRTYQQTISSISQNPDLPATERARLTQNALDVRNSSQTMVQNLYDVKLDWSSKSSGSGSSGTGSSGTGSTGSTSSRSSNAGSGTSGSIPSGLSPIQGLMYGTAQRLAYEKGRAR